MVRIPDVPPTCILFFRRWYGRRGLAVRLEFLLCISHINSLFHLSTIIITSRGQKRKTRHRHLKTRSWPLGAAYSWLLDVSFTNTAIIFKDADNPTFLNCNAKAAIVAELLELLNTVYFVPRPILRPVPHRHLEFHPLTAQQQQEIDVCLNRPLPILDDEQVSQDRLDNTLNHFNRQYRVSGRCPLHRDRRRTYHHCSHCGVPLHHGLCHDVFHSVLDLTGVTLD